MHRIDLVLKRGVVRVGLSGPPRVLRHPARRLGLGKLQVKVESVPDGPEYGWFRKRIEAEHLDLNRAFTVGHAGENVVPIRAGRGDVSLSVRRSRDGGARNGLATRVHVARLRCRKTRKCNEK